MRLLTVVLIASGLAGNVGCRKQESGETTGPAARDEVLVRYHFVGTTSLTDNTNASRFRELWNLPETRRLVEQTLQKLAHAPRTLYGDSVTPAQDERGAALLRPMLDDLPRHESFVQVRGSADKTAEWTLLVKLPADRLKLWRANLRELMQVWQLGKAATNMVEGFAAWEVERTDAPALVRCVEAGPWLALGVGQRAMTAVHEALRRIKSGGRPIAVASNYWLEAELNLPRLGAVLDFPPTIQWPRAKCTVTGSGENLRSKARLIFPANVTGPLEPWQIPTNIINDPLISFTAVRGVSPWLKECAMLRQLGLNPAPNELFFWAQGQLTFQSYLAFPLKQAASQLERAANRAPSLLGTNWHDRGMGHIGWRTNTHEMVWTLPYINPFLKPTDYQGTEFVFGGLFPPSPLTNPPPGELLSELATEPKLVYYDWEITQARLTSWRIMAQLFAMLADKPQLTTNTASLAWMMAVESKLGNTITEVTAESPVEWSVARKSHLGFTAVELVALTRWLESVAFPKLSFELPADRTPRPASKSPPPAANAPTQPAPRPPGP